MSLDDIKETRYLFDAFCWQGEHRASGHWNPVRPWACAWQVLPVEMQVTFVPHTLAQLDFASLEVPALNK